MAALHVLVTQNLIKIRVSRKLARMAIVRMRGEGLPRGLHRLIEAERGGGGLQPLDGAVEEQDAELLLQRLDVAAERRLAVADAAGGGGE